MLHRLTLAPGQGRLAPQAPVTVPASHDADHGAALLWQIGGRA